jgi:hypothetical protein
MPGPPAGIVIDSSGESEFSGDPDDQSLVVRLLGDGVALLTFAPTEPESEAVSDGDPVAPDEAPDPVASESAEASDEAAAADAVVGTDAPSDSPLGAILTAAAVVAVLGGAFGVWRRRSNAAPD